MTTSKLFDVDCPPSEARYVDDSPAPAGATIPMLAARLNNASNRYRMVMERPNSASCHEAAANGLARAAEELTAAIADSLS